MMSRIQVVWIVPALDFGGMETRCFAVAPRLAEAGIDLTVINIGSEGRVARDLAGAGVRVLNLDRSAKPYAVSTIRALSSFLKQIKPAVVHARVVEANWLGGIAALLNGVPFYVEEIGVPRRRHWIRNVYLRFIYNRATRIIAVSQTVCKWLEDHLYAKRVRPTVLQNALARDIPHRSEPFSESKQPIIIGTVARLAGEKGIDVLLDGFSRLDQSRCPCELRIVGDGPQRSKLEAQAEQLGITEHVTFLGYHTDVAPFLSSLDLFVLPSRTEGISNALLEAMASELPCVATAVGDTPALLKDGRGSIIPSDDPSALAQALEHLCTHPGAANAMAERGRQHIEKHHQLDSYVRKLVNLYRQDARA